MGAAFSLEVINAFLGMDMGWSTFAKIHALAQAVFAAFFLYWLRSYNRAFYGLLEIAFALFFLTFAIFTHDGLPEFNQANISYLAQIAAGICVFIRGLGNTSQGMKASK